jgi:glycosyltransferase involved in cell wall biosynthesis
VTRAAFYSPMTAPDATAASGAPRMSALLQRALAAAGVDVLRPDLPRTYDGRGDRGAQLLLKEASERVAQALIRTYRGDPAKPELWFSYHVYYKSPDWIGPAVARALDIPYVIAEGSHAPKRAGGPWAVGHDGSTAALKAANRLLAMTRFDRVCLDQVAPGQVCDLKPFIDTVPFANARPRGEDVPHFVAVGMMRNERKRASYALLAGALRRLGDLPLTLTVAGDGPFRSEIEAMFASAAPAHAVRFLGTIDAAQIPALLASGDIFAWPGFGEAYGLAFLEAQAAGLPVVACRDRGVPDAVHEGETALLSPVDDPDAYAANLRRLAADAALRGTMGEKARRFVHEERSLQTASATLRRVIEGIV